MGRSTGPVPASRGALERRNRKGSQKDDVFYAPRVAEVGLVLTKAASFRR